MSYASASSFQLMSLGRPFQLGMLYDIRSDQLIPGITLWDPDTLKANIHTAYNIRTTKYSISTEDTFEEKSKMLGINADLKLSVLAGLVGVSGSAAYINDRKKTENVERVVLQYSTRTHFDQLTMAHLGEGQANHPKIFDKQIATHVVTGIVYGAEAFLLFEHPSSNVEQRSEVCGSIKGALNKIPKVQVDGGVELNLTKEEKQITEKLTCQFYGDFNPKSNPTTFEEAVKLYIELPTLLGPDNKNAVPQQVWLSPLHLLDNSAAKLYRQISSTSAVNSIELVDNLEQLRIRANDFINSLSSKLFLQQIKQQLSKFSNRISGFENDIKKKLVDILPKIRSGATEEKELSILFQQVVKSPFNRQSLEDWLGAKTQEIEIINNFVNALAKEKIIDLSELALAKAQSSIDCEYIFCLAIHVTDRNEPFLNEIDQYREDSTCDEKGDITSINQFSSENDILSSSRQNIMLFIKFTEANRDKKDCRFVAKEECSEKFEKKKGISIIIYHNSSPTNLKIPSEPTKPHATVMEDRSVKIEWSKPRFGNESILKYEIYGKKDSNEQWKLLLTTTDATESTIISNLDGKYQFKIKGITVFGVTPDSSVSNTIQVASNPQTKVEDCGGNACPRCGLCRDWYYRGDYDHFLKCVEHDMNDGITDPPPFYTLMFGATCFYSRVYRVDSDSGSDPGSSGDDSDRDARDRDADAAARDRDADAAARAVIRRRFRRDDFTDDDDFRGFLRRRRARDHNFERFTSHPICRCV